MIAIHPGRAVSQSQSFATDEPGSSVRAVLIALWVSVTMIVLVPVVLMQMTPSPDDNTWLWLFPLLIVCGLRFGWIVGDGKRRLIEMSFWVFTYVFLGIAPFVQLRSGSTPETTPGIDHSLDLTAMLVVLFGTGAFLVGILLSNLRGPERSTDDPPARQLNLRRATILSLFALLCNAYFLAKVGMTTMFSSRQEYAGVVAAVWPSSPVAALMRAIAGMSVLVAFVALVKLRNGSDPAQRPNLGLVIVVGIVLAVSLSPIVNARYLVGTAALAVAAVFGLFASKVRFRAVAVAAIAALVLLFPLADAFRYSSSAEFKTGSPLDSLESADFDSFAQINNTVLFVHRDGITAGRQALGVVLFWVPRSLWPDKPDDTGITLANSRGYTVTNLSAPLWAEIYINVGWIGLILGMLGIGYFVGIRDRRIELSLRRSRAPSVLACILPFYLFILLRGSLLQSMSFLAIVVGCAAFVTTRTSLQERS